MAAGQAVDIISQRFGQHGNQINEIRELTMNAQNMASNALRQLNDLPAAQQVTSASGIRTKVAEPPKFSGESGTIKFDEWKDLVELYCGVHGMVLDKAKILVALSYMREPASKLVHSYKVLNSEGKDMGSIGEFWSRVARVYGQKDVKRTATKDLEALLNDKKSAQKDLLEFSVRFTVLLANSEHPYTDKYMIDKLYQAVEERLQNFILNRGRDTWPTTATEFMDYLVAQYKELYPDRLQSHIFEKGPKASKADPDAMEVDSAQKGKGKGKAAQANSSETKKKVSKPCTICTELGKTFRARNHETKDCFSLKDKDGSAKPSTSKSTPPAASSSKAATSSSSGGGKGKNHAAIAAKKNTMQQLRARMAEMEKEVAGLEADNDEEVVVNTSRIVEWTEEDEKELEKTPPQEPVDELEAAMARLRSSFAKSSPRSMDFLDRL